MRPMVVLLVLFCLLLGCGDNRRRQASMQEKLGQIAAKPTATKARAAKALYDETSKFVAWLEAHPEDGTPEMLTEARELRNKRALEIGEIAGGKVFEGIKKALEGLFGDEKSAVVGETVDKALGEGKSISITEVGKKVGEAGKWVLGVNDPRFKDFSCKDADGNPVDVMQEGFSKLCVR